MLVCELTPNHMGITLWGDYQTIERIHELIHFIDSSATEIDDKDAFLGHLAYDLRKAMEGDRKGRKVLVGNGSEVDQYGVDILIPILLIQMSVIRSTMAFLPTTKLQQATIYEFEDAIESILYKSIPRKAQDILEKTRMLGGISYALLAERMMGRCLYLLETSVKERLKILPQLMYSFHPLYNVFSIQTIAADKFAQGDIELPEFEW